MMKENEIGDVVSIQQLCSLLSISRSRYYQLVNAGYLAPPVYSTDTKRAYFTRELAEKNLSVVKNNVGLNGKVCLFYHTRRRTGKMPTSPVKSPNQVPSKKADSTCQELTEQLSLLGLKNLKSAQVEMVISKLYPEGIQNLDEGEVLKTVYRAIVAQNSTDNPDR